MIPPAAPLGLPSVPAELKSITPYLQRAEEIKPQDPVIAYWCTYYAAQQGIAVELKDKATARPFLFSLLDLLERVKAELGQNDAIHDEAASAAYVENFALRVFSIADNEDRRGKATRLTAKKFLAAANFLEVLSTFDKPVSTDAAPATTINVQEKIRYAKWKAADIAKAIREGRTPTPGAADEEVQPQHDVDEGEPAQVTTPPPSVPTINVVAAQAQSTLLAPETPQHPGSAAAATSLTSPGAWSTMASAGTPLSSGRAWEDDGTESHGVDEDTRTDEEKQVRFAEDIVGGLTPSVIQGDGSEQNPFTFDVTPPVVQVPLSHANADSVEDSEGEVERVVSGDSLAPSAPDLVLPDIPQSDNLPLPPAVSIFPPPFSPPLPPPPSIPIFPASESPPPAPPPTSPPSIPPSIPPHIPPAPRHQPLPHSLPSYGSGYGPSVATPPPLPVAPVVEATITQPPPELTPLLVARVQKLCRFAISALDYEDADTAREELRKALKMLGG